MKVKLNEDKKVQLRGLLSDLYSESKKFKATKEAEIGAEYYYQRAPQQAIKGASTYVAPVVMEKIDDLHTQIMDVIGKLKDNFSATSKDLAKPLTGNVEKQIVELIDNTMFSDEDEQVLEVATKESLITGTSAVRWYTDEDIQFEMEYFVDLTDEQLAYRKATLEDKQSLEITSTTKTDNGNLNSGQISTPSTVKRARYSHVSYNDLMVDPKCHVISKANYLCIKTLTDKQSLIDQGFKKELVLSITSETDVEERARLSTGVDFIPHLNSQESFTDSTLDSVIVYEHYVRTSIIDGKSKLYRVVMAGTTILDVVYEDTIPLAVFRPVPNIESFWGSSVAYSLKSQQDVKTAGIRGWIDNMHNANHGRVIALENSYNKRDLMDNRPNGIVEVKALNAVIPYPYNPLPQGLPDMLGLMDMDADNISGISAEAMGRGESALASGITASQVAIAHSKSDLTIKNISKGIMLGVRELAKGLYSEWQKLYPKLPTISTFKFDLNTESGRRSKAVDILAAAQALAQAGLSTPQLNDAIAREYLRNVGLTSLVELIKTPQQVQQEAKAQQQNPALQLQLATAQEQIKFLQAQTQSLLQKTEIEADKTASELNLKEQEFKFKADKEIADMNLQDRKQTLAEFDTGTRAKVAFLELGLRSQETAMNVAAQETQTALELMSDGDSKGY